MAGFLLFDLKASACAFLKICAFAAVISVMISLQNSWVMFFDFNALSRMCWNILPLLSPMCFRAASPSSWRSLRMGSALIALESLCCFSFRSLLIYFWMSLFSLTFPCERDRFLITGRTFKFIGVKATNDFDNTSGSRYCSAV